MTGMMESTGSVIGTSS